MSSLTARTICPDNDTLVIHSRGGPQRQRVLRGHRDGLVVERPRQGPALGPQRQLVGVVLVERVPRAARQLDPARPVEVREIDDHPHRRHRGDLVSLGGVPGVRVDETAAAADLDRSTVEDPVDEPDARVAQRRVDQRQPVQVAPTPSRRCCATGSWSARRGPAPWRRAGCRHGARRSSASPGCPTSGCSACRGSSASTLNHRSPPSGHCSRGSSSWNVSSSTLRHTTLK